MSPVRSPSWAVAWCRRTPRVLRSSSKARKRPQSWGWSGGCCPSTSSRPADPRPRSDGSSIWRWSCAAGSSGRCESRAKRRSTNSPSCFSTSWRGAWRSPSTPRASPPSRTALPIRCSARYCPNACRAPNAIASTPPTSPAPRSRSSAAIGTTRSLSPTGGSRSRSATSPATASLQRSSWGRCGTRSGPRRSMHKRPPSSSSARTRS